MALKVQPTLANDTIARTRADMLLSMGSYAAIEAMTYCAIAHQRKALFDADSELAEHWEKVRDIFEDAKRRIRGLS